MSAQINFFVNHENLDFNLILRIITEITKVENRNNGLRSTKRCILTI